MNRAVSFIAVCFFIPGTAPAAPIEGGAALPLLELWLNYHEMGLCQGLDSTFEFSEAGIKVRSFVEEEKSLQKFRDLLEPLRESFQIDLEVTPPAVEKEPNEDNENDPPPGLWENYELRYNLGDPVAQARGRPDFEWLRAGSISDEILKQRLRLYARQVLDWSKNMERYACDLRELVPIVFDPSVDPIIQAKARGISLAHARESGKLLEKLEASLSIAFPESKKKERSRGNAPKPGSSPTSLLHSSNWIAENARALKQRIKSFVRPEQFTVGLEELRAPSLLESIKDLSTLISQFQKEMDRSAKTKKSK